MKHTILFIDEVAALLRISPASVNRLEAEARNGIGNFPISCQTKPRGKRRWLASQIEEYIASLAKVNEVAIPSTKSKKQQERDFQRRQNRARAVLRQHGIER